MQVSFGVKQHQSKTVHEAVSLTVELKSYLATKPYSEGVSHITVADEPPVESVQAVQRDMIGVMQKLVERVGKLEVATKQRYPIGQIQDVDMPLQQGRGNKRIQWARLLAEDVISPDTKLEVVLQIWVGPGLRAFKGAGIKEMSPMYLPNMLNVHINNITNYFVGRVLKTPVFFLVDMGAGISLLWGDMWNARKNGMKKEVAECLVGVDEIPIKLRGTVLPGESDV